MQVSYESEQTEFSQVSNTPDSPSSIKRLPVTLSTLSLGLRIKNNVFRRERSSLPDNDVPISGTEVNPKEGCQLLHQIDFLAYPNQLTGIIGPSGCGKTTFLNVLAKRARGSISGSVSYNNVPVSSRDLRKCVSLCYANDKLLPYLTVEETLNFAAMLKLGKATAAERKARIQRVIEDMSLGHVRDTKIGGIWSKGLSTGEVRRTAIAVELIGDPGVLLLDEPTSGLDAALAFETMYVLKSVSEQGRTIICSIHQPRTAIFDMFDSIMLMARGRCLYQGPCAGVRDFMTLAAGIPMSHTLNTADGLLEIASQSENSCKVPNHDVLAIANIFANSPQANHIRAEIASVRASEYPKFQHKERDCMTQWFIEIVAVAIRSFRNTVRNPLSISLVLIIQLLMGCFLGAIFFKLPSNFLPETLPANVGSESSALQFLFNNSLVKFINTGIDGSGKNPLLDMLLMGVDGNNSEPLLTLRDRGLWQTYYNVMPCAHEVWELDQLYPSVDYSAYYDEWGDNLEGDNEWAFGTRLSPPAMTTYFMQTLQTLDYVLKKIDYDELKEVFRGIPDSSILFYHFVLLCRSEARHIAGTLSACTGLSLPRPAYGLSSSATIEDTCDALLSDWTAPTTQSEIGTIDKLVTDAAVFRSEGPVATLNVPSLPKNGSLRHLQATAIVSASLGDLTKVLPPVLVKVINRLPEYRNLFTTCPHEFCVLLRQSLESESESDIMKGVKAIADYGSVIGAIMNIAGALFFSIANIGFASYDALVSIPQERSMINREMANHHYHPSSYFIGKSVADIVFQLLPSMCLVSSFYLLIGVDTGVHGVYFFKYLGICIAMVFAAYGFAYLASAASPTMEVAVTATPIILVVFLCCSGFFVRDAAIPFWMTWVKYLSIYRWGFFALVLNQFPPTQSYGGIPDTFSLALIGITESKISVCCLALIALGVGFRILAYLALKFLHRKIGVEQ